MIRIVLNLQVICLIIAIVLSPACNDNTRVTLHEAHVYKGRSDTHPDSQQVRDKRLRQRALLVFSDR